jgi:hypothetical protein
MTAPVDVLAATVADLKAKGWITDVAASLLIEANAKDRAAVDELAEFSRSALHYVDEAAAAMRDSHRTAGKHDSLVIAEVVAKNLRAALARVGGAK